MATVTGISERHLSVDGSVRIEVLGKAMLNGQNNSVNYAPSAGSPIAHWNELYQNSQVSNLWSENPVPYVDELIHRNYLAGKSLLDVPCGDGRNSVKLARSCKSLVAVDASSIAVNRTSQRLEQNRVENAICLLAEIEDLPFANEQFDLIFCWDLLSHLKSPDRALSELFRVAKKAGYVVASLFSNGDPNKGVDMESQGDDSYLLDGKFFFQYYDRSRVFHLASTVPAKSTNVEVSRWTEPPHPGYRDYVHEHESWVFALQK